MAPASKADTFLVSCIDPRLTDDTTFHFSALGRADRYSEMRIAGAALAAVDGNRPAWNTALWENLAASRQLHGISRVTFLNHRDCGAMDLWAGRKLADDPAEETRQHTQVLEAAAAAVRQRHPDLAVELRLMNLDGSVRSLPCPGCGPGPLRAEAVTAGADTAGFRALAGARLAGGAALTDAAEQELLRRAVTDYGLTAAEARAALQSVAPAAAGEAGRARDVATFLRAQGDRAGRLGSTDLAQGAALYRRLAGGTPTAREAARRVASIAEAEGLSPRPEGLLRSTRWFHQLAA